MGGGARGSVWAAAREVRRRNRGSGKRRTQRRNIEGTDMARISVGEIPCTAAGGQRGEKGYSTGEARVSM
jgi:hypothetical protein